MKRPPRLVTAHLLANKEIREKVITPNLDESMHLTFAADA